jgi:hypothetical protein
MKRGMSSISARWPIATLVAVTLGFAVVGSTVSGAARQAAAYYLIGDATNSGTGVTRFNSTNSNTPWYFYSSGASSTTITAECPNGSACWAVQGKGTSIGVYGTAANPGTNGNSAVGVQGIGGNTTTNGTSYGGFFSSSNSASSGKSYGVYASGATAGVYATSPNDGIRATSTSTTGNGVHGTGSGDSFYGVWGEAGGGGYGSVGTSTGGNGSYGATTGTTTNVADIAGVYGYNALGAVGSRSLTNSGIYGTCTNCNGVSGSSANYVGVRGAATGAGTNTYGGNFTAKNGVGLYAATSTGWTGLLAGNGTRDAYHYAAYFNGNVYINGSYTVAGVKTGAVATTRGDRLVYAEEATQSYLSDQGSATLKRGRAIVKIDPLFAQTVDLSKPYMVIVTPLSFDTAGLGAGNLKPGSFEVRELNRGKGHFTFSWRITALRKGYADIRMAAAPSVRPAMADGTPALRPSSSDTPMTDPSAAPPTRKVAPPAADPSSPQEK